ncbi:hypothetical protein [Microbacterium sp. 4NA327F11]|uniref:hypothetical protein n=1 Tax=Microbacterium sp. 4NA327F11 TaxID=2502229 RepID=UPI0010F90501|nr:hypothetical protein [Microbacterium sp. 4NA327F11]
MSDSAEQNATDPNDDRRRIVRDQLKRWHPFLSVMYDDVLRDLQSLELGGESRLLVMHISHNMREIVNGIGEARGLSLGKQVEPSTSTLIRELASMADVFTFDVTGEARAVPVPRELAVLPREVVNG